MEKEPVPSACIRLPRCPRTSLYQIFGEPSTCRLPQTYLHVPARLQPCEEGRGPCPSPEPEQLEHR